MSAPMQAAQQTDAATKPSISGAHIMTLDHTTGRVTFFGPFADLGIAARWGAEWQAENGDNPCWQRLERAPEVQFQSVAQVRV